MKKAMEGMVYALIALILALLVSLNVVAAQFSGIITQYICGFGIDYSSDEFVAARNEATALAIEIAGEGTTLLKNAEDKEGNATLPLKSPNLNVFGWGGCDNGYIYMGFGSGSNSTYGRISLYQGLRNAGFALNEELCSLYNADSFRRDDGWAASSWKLHEPIGILTPDVLARAQSHSDTALVVISRFGMEGYDLPLQQNNEKGEMITSQRHYLELSADEEALLDIVTAHFDKVIVLLNDANIMEAGFLDDDKIDAALAAYFPGNHGANAIGKILTGETTPSGHTVDTWAYDMSTAPSFANATTNGSRNYTDHSIVQYVDYAENIYIGYYWYETADAEGFWDSVYAKNRWNLENGYESVVQFPFGYGLSYTDFSWTVKEVVHPSGAELHEDDEVGVTVFVENTGDRAGQDVVELYYTLPYVRGGIEKAAIKLGAFAKTSVLQPGDVEELTLTFPVRDMASYDCYDDNFNKFMGYELEGGEYTLSLRTDVHTPKEMENGEWTYTVPAGGYRYETDAVTGHKVENLFTTYTNPTSGASSVNIEEALQEGSISSSIDGADTGQGINYLTREDFVTTFPEPRAARACTDDFFNRTYYCYTPNQKEESAPVRSETQYTLDDMILTDEEGAVKGIVPYEDKKWDDLVHQLSVDVAAELCGNGGLHTISIEEIKKPYTVDSDGPAGFNTTIFGSGDGYATGYPCEVVVASSWNWKIAYQMGLFVGKEAEAANIDGWYGPACDTHRSPFGGRNYEYYSEDGYLSGVMCAYVTYGAKQNGLYAFVKHFAVNECENIRGTGYTWLTEQALREIYLKPFEIAVKTGGAIGIMSSYNRVGSTRTSGSYNLLTSVLRDEWGFRGSVISDYSSGAPTLVADEAIRAGNDIMMDSNGSKNLFTDRTSATAQNALYKGAKDILYCYVSAQVSMAMDQGIPLDSVIGTRTAVFPWWTIILGVVDAVIVGGCAVWGIFVWKKGRKID